MYKLEPPYYSICTSEVPVQIVTLHDGIIVDDITDPALVDTYFRIGASAGYTTDEISDLPTDRFGHTQIDYRVSPFKVTCYIIFITDGEKYWHPCKLQPASYHYVNYIEIRN